MTTLLLLLFLQASPPQDVFREFPTGVFKTRSIRPQVCTAAALKLPTTALSEANFAAWAKKKWAGSLLEIRSSRVAGKTYTTKQLFIGNPMGTWTQLCRNEVGSWRKCQLEILLGECERQKK